MKNKILFSISILILLIIVVFILNLNDATIEYVGDTLYVYDTVNENDFIVHGYLGDIKFTIVNPTVDKNGINTIELRLLNFFSHYVEVNAYGVKEFNVEVIDKSYELGTKFNKDDLVVSVIYEDNSLEIPKPNDIEIIMDNDIIQEVNTIICKYRGAVTTVTFEGKYYPYVQSDEYPMIYENKETETYIEITKERYWNTDCYVAHIISPNPHIIKSRLAVDDGTVNYKYAKMTDVYAETDAIFMTNADWSVSVDFNRTIVLRNGILLRSGGTNSEHPSMSIENDGHMRILSGSSESAILKRNTWQVFSFYGRDLIFGKAYEGFINPWRGLNPRTFIGEVKRDDKFLEYYLIVADGRTDISKGLNHNMMSFILHEKGCTFGYNLDGGSSSEMIFDGKLLNNPSRGYEKPDHDFIYISYGE